MATLLRWFFGLFDRRDYADYRNSDRKTKYAVKGKKNRKRR